MLRALSVLCLAAFASAQKSQGCQGFACTNDCGMCPGAGVEVPLEVEMAGTTIDISRLSKYVPHCLAAIVSCLHPRLHGLRWAVPLAMAMPVFIAFGHGTWSWLVGMATGRGH